MLLRIKDREEVIQLLVMDPQLCGKLLMLHRKGNKVDVEALHDRIPLWQGAGKGPQMGSHGYKRLRRWKIDFVDASGGLGIYGNIQAKELGQEMHKGPTRVGARPTPLCPCGRIMAPPTSSPSLLVVFWSKKIIAKVLFCLDSVWYSFSAKLKNKEKTVTGTGLQVNRLVPKII